MENLLYQYLNNLCYLWKRNNWMLNPKNYIFPYENIPIIKPVFLLGNQGDGLTLLARMLKRNSQVVSVTGNCKYWAGADEMQNVFEPILSPDISGIRVRAHPHPILIPPRSWSYACDDLIGKYRKTEKDADNKMRRKIRRAIGMVIHRYGKNIDNPRFVDKSQVFTVKISFINELLKDCSPYFILVTRNPYVTCFRAATGKARDMEKYSKFFSLDERMKICIEHWHNVMKAVEDDRNKIDNFIAIKFEDLIEKPKQILKKTCDFIQLNFSIDMIPQKHHKLPFGVRFKDRWYPLRTHVNKKYLEQIPKKYVEWIHQKCGEVAEKYGYLKPI